MQLVNAWVLLLLWPTTVSANTPCGTIPLGSTNRLVGGLPADVLDWPWQALLLSHQYYQVSEVSSHRIYGGGTVISNKWVLTAAHIFEHAGLQKSFGTKRWNRLLVILGMTSYPKVGGKIADSVFAFEPGDVILHEKYDHETYDFDIALIKFGEAKKVRGSRFIPNSHVKEIPFGNYIQPICLPCLNSCDKTGGTSFNADACREYATSIAPADLPIIPDVTVTGYGSTVARDPAVNNFKYPETLQKAKLVLLDNNSCKDGLKKVNEIYSSIKHNVIAQYTHQMLCALGKHQENFSDSCQGDSGGPLVKQVVSTNGSKCWTQIGIVSWGLGCASRPDDGGFIPGFYANVASLMGWVLEKMGIRKVLQSDGTILCPRLTPPKNGYFSGNAENREVGSVVTLACNEGYTLKGKNSSKCIATAVWEPFATCQGAWSDWISWSTCSETCRGIQERTRFCEDKNCSGKNKEVRLCNTLGCLPMCAPVEAPLNGTMSVTPTPDVFYPGTVVEFFCDEGWFLKGPSSIICQPNEKWSDERNPVCGNSEGCEPRQAPSHGSMAVTPDPHSFYPGTIVQFSCDKEWLLQDGPSSITCSDDNTWSDEARPACQEFKCQAPPELPNGKVTGHGSKLWSARYFACNPGFNLQGHRVSRCNRKGVWTGRKRSCVVYRCSDPVPPQNGIISHYESGVGGRTTFECNDGFIMEGSNFAICNESGRWGPTPTCKVSIARTRVSDPRTCHPPAVPINGHIKEQKSTYGDGEYVVFECSSGMVMDGQSWTQCLGSDTYRYPSPTCSARTSCLGSCTYIEDAHCQCDSGCFWAGTCCLDHFVYCNSNFQFP